MIEELFLINYFGSFRYSLPSHFLTVNFDYLSPYYSIGEKFLFGTKLDFHRRLFPQILRTSRKVLLLGEGRGEFLKYLLKKNSFCEITIVESSKKMAESINCLILNQDRFRVKIKNLPIEHYKCDQKFDFICSFFFWDCFSDYQLNQYLPQMLNLLCDKGYWHNADFVDQTKINCFQFLKNFIFIKLLYLFFRYTAGIDVNTVYPVYPVMLKNNMRLIQSVESSNKLLKSELYRKIGN